MGNPTLDEVDHAILTVLQEDARHNTNAAISDRIGVSPSTVSKRLAGLESTGVVTGYDPAIDYERAGFPFEVLFLCTAPIPERERLVEQTLSVDGVVNVRELMTGRENVHIQVIGGSKEEITRIAHRLDELGYTVADEILLRSEYSRPSVRFDYADAE